MLSLCTLALALALALLWLFVCGEELAGVAGRQPWRAAFVQVCGLVALAATAPVLLCWYQAGCSLPHLWAEADCGLPLLTWTAWTGAPGAGLSIGWSRGSLVALLLVPVCLFSLLSLERPGQQALVAHLGLALVLAGGYLLVTTSSVILFVLAFEGLVLATLGLLQVSSKSERILEAAFELYVWALFGSAYLLCTLGVALASGLTSFEALTQPRAAFLVTLLACGFSVKVPLWPCFSWLLRVHVEASTEFSILLSGVIVKFGVLGLARLLSASPAEAGLAAVVLAASLVGCVEAAARLAVQQDLKRVVALVTVLEMNWACFALAWGGCAMGQVAILVLVAHSVATSLEFFLVELVQRRYGTRDVGQLSGCFAQYPLLWACSLGATLSVIGFPGLALFGAKLSFFSAVCSCHPELGLVFLLLFIAVVPVCVFRAWAAIWFGHTRVLPCARDLSGFELAVCLGLLTLSLLLGLCPQLAWGCWCSMGASQPADWLAARTQTLVGWLRAGSV